MIMRKRAYYYSFISILLRGILVSSESVENCTVKEHLPCLLYKDVQSCSPPDLKKRFPKLFLNNSRLPSKASSFVSNISEEYTDGTVFFTPPQDGSIHFLKGFEVMQHTFNNTLPTCHIFDLSVANWKAEPEDFEVSASMIWSSRTVFTLILHAMEPNIEYVFELYTLPLSPPEYEKYESLRLRMRFGSHPRVKRAWSHDWAISIDYQLYPTTRQVVVNFKSPVQYGITEYEVTLKNLTAGWKQRVNTAQNHHTFTNVISGVYEIWVRPSKGRGSCLPCRMTTRTRNFTVEFAASELKENGEALSKESVTQSGVSTDSVAKEPYSQLATANQVATVQVAKSSTSEDPVPRKTETQRKTTDDPVYLPKVQVTKSTTSKGSDTQRTTTDDQVHAPTEHVTKSTTGENSVSETHSMQPATKAVQVAMGVVGSLLCIGVVVLFLYFCYRRRSAGDKHDHHKPNETGDDLDSTVKADAVNRGVYLNNHNVEKKELQRRPKLYVLYEEDHGLHRKVVDSFTEYLQNHCYCDVMPGHLHFETTWAHEDIQNADYVMIVNSKLAYGIYKSLLNTNRELAEDGSSGNVMVPGINCILRRFLQGPNYDKIVMVYFDYTHEDYIIPNICPGYNYKLMKNFTELLMYIHRLKRTDNLEQYDLPLDGKYYLKPTGKILQNEIRNAAEYERQNPDGFIYTCPYLRSFSNASDESGFVSGLQQEPVSHFFAPSHVQNNMDFACRNLIPLTPPVFTEYSKTTYPGLPPQSFRPYVYSGQARNYQGSQFALETGGQRNYIACMSNETPESADTGVQFEFFPPDDDISEFDTASVSQSEQMMKINARYSGAEDDKKGYDWKQDLSLLCVQSGETPFSDSKSLGEESV